MNADADKMRESLVGQLSSFEERLDSKIDDVRMIADIQESLGKLLSAGGGNEAEVRRVLQQRYESGNLRKETFQLVKSMLDRYVTEQAPTTGTVVLPKSNQPAGPSGTQAYVKTIADAALELEAEESAHSSTVVLPASVGVLPETAEDRVQIGSVLRDRFLLQERVAGGSMGVVYKALDRRLAEAGAANPYVALKVLSPELSANAQALRALQQEAAKGRCLSHPNIVRFLDLDRDEDLYFIVMEWLDGRTLADILDAPETGKFNKQQAFEIVQQLGKALSYAHRCGIVHADIKPGNIMILPNGDAKLFDFGVARVRQKQIEEQKAFDPGVLGLLTPAYSSMQVLTGEDPTPSDDVFSLACLLYRLLAGYRVFGPRNAAEAAAEGMKPQCPQGLGEARWRVLKKALAYARVARYESMDEFVEALSIGTEEPITVIVPMRDELDLPESTHGPGRWIAGTLVLVGLLGGAAYQFGLLDGISQQILGSDDGIADLAAVVDNRIAEQADNSMAVAQTADIGAVAGNSSIGENLMSNAEQGSENGVTAVADEDDSALDIVEQVVESVAGDEVRVDLDEVLAEDMDSAQTASSEPAVPLVDFSLLPPANSELLISMDSAQIAIGSVTMREGRAPVTIDFVRDDSSNELTLRLEEIGFSGNRSPWISGEYGVNEGAFVEFPAGQERARITLSMRSDPLREADQQSTLRLREVDNASNELAQITVYLEDDDQRAFEATLPANTVAFAVSQISVNERDPAVQIDIQRFNPDATRLVVGYVLRDITATQGEDYFAPSSYTIEFGPNQRSARILIPLVQDFVFEDNEAFSVELSTADSSADVDVYLRTAVIIRDDDS